MRASPLPSAGLILAGGAGRRFGHPKAFALIPDGRTFLEACADVMVQGGLGKIVATLPPDSKEIVPPMVHPVLLPQPDLDMFASITLGLQTLVSDSTWHRVILLPVDHPLIQPSTITQLTDLDVAAAIPTLNGRHGHPIMICRTVAEQVADGRLPGPTLRDVLRSASADNVAVIDRGIRANCNTPETLREAWRLVND